ncbi:flavonol sulfotransferase-like [Lycium barbarum]|uniref:flavonol sulfotransferase-like n=1 Tax=Lycium barbarum TaxID=112863 RepID=UPI00293EC360|nr:flavonol sulfotransferase-like [Lycium barbarum]
MENLPAVITEEEEEANTKFKKLISTLPKEKGTTVLCQYQGFWYPLSVLRGILYVQENFNSCPTDIFLCSAPKTGTTWLKALSFAISTRDRFDIENNNPLLTNVPHVLIPFLESDPAKIPSINRDTHIPLIATHLPFSALPKSVKSLDGTKIIYVCREPKDTFISLWHFMQNWPMRLKQGTTTTEPISTYFEKEFELFCEGKTMGGPYWDHVLEYWKKSLEKPESVLFLKYEELTKDTLFYVRKMAEFMGKPFSRDEEEQGVPEKIVKLCSFENLSNLEVNKSGKHDTFEIDNKNYFRKGKPGDWKNHLTSNMIDIMDNITKEKLSGSSFCFGASSTANI